MKPFFLLVPAAILASAVHAAPKNSEAFNIPPLKQVSIDGLTDDWRQPSMSVDVLTDTSGKVRSRLDSSAPIRIGYDERGIVLLVLWRDDQFQEADTPESLWQKDSLEIFFANKVGGSEVVQVMVGSGRDPRFPTPRVQLLDKRQNATLRAKPLKIETGIKANNRGTTVEVLVPWSDLGIDPVKGTEFGFQIVVNDVDTGVRRQMMWFPSAGASYDSKQMVSLRLAEKPDALVRVAATVKNERFRRIVADVVTFPEMSGESVEVLEGKRIVGRGKLQQLPDGFSGAKVQLPVPPRGQNYGPLEVRVGKERDTTLLPLDFESERQVYIRDARLKFDSFVFATTDFPNGDFEQPSLIEDAIGPYSLSTTFYDADYNEVKIAEKPGRYGAVVRVQPENGPAFRRYVTLYRQPEKFDIRKNKPVFGAALLAEAGLDADVLRERETTVNDYVTSRFESGFYFDIQSGAALAGLKEAKPGDGIGNWNNPTARDNVWLYGLKRKLGDTKQLPHLLDLPKGYEADKTKKWPLMLFLHGSGERGNNLNQVRTLGPPSEIAKGRELPFIVVSPQAPAAGNWLAPQLADLLDDIQLKYRVDTDRVYVTGLSMGGNGTFNLASQYPTRFAAIAPMATGGDPGSVYRLKNLPTWFFVGGKDGAVPERADKTVAAMKEAQVPVKYTFYPEAGHSDTWEKGYADPTLYEWLLTHTLRR